VAAREKINSAAPVAVSGPALFSALRNIWKGASASSHQQPSSIRASHGPDLGNQKWPAELRSLIDPLTMTRRRILTNTFLSGWVNVWTWILAGLMVAGAVSPKLAWAVISAGVVVVAGAIAVVILTWRARPSAYEAACRLDSAAGLRDRVSTAVHLGGVENPDGMVLRQRQDAVMHLAGVSPQALFPVRLPAVARRALVLAVATAGLFVYRIHYKPPIAALLQTTARSQLVQSILTPIVHAMEKDLQRTMALIKSKPDSPADETRPGIAATTDDLWKASDDPGSKLEDGQQDSQEANAGDQMQDQPQSSMQNGQGEMKPGDSEQQQEGSQSQQSNNGSERMGGDAQQQADSPNSENSHQSLSQSLMQALKNMLSNSPNQQANNQANQKQPNSQGMQQSGNSSQPGAGEADKKGDSRGSSDSQQKATQNSSSGAGSQQGSKELKKDQAALPVNAVPDRVALESNGFKEQTRMRIDGGTGTARVPVRDVSPQAVAVTNGAEQENIPARYRLYVQRYFEHPENGQK
jgi:hypothetical protein